MSVPSWAEPYIDLINNNTSETGFFWKNVEQFILESAQSYRVNLISNDYTFVKSGVGNIINARLVTNSMSALNGIAVANITSNANGCLLTINSSTTPVPFTDSSGQHNSIMFRVFVYGSSYYFTNYSEGTSQSYSYSEQFSSIENAIQLLANQFRNIDIVVDGEYWSRVSPISEITSNGGGATHIAKVTGQLKDLSSNLSDILMVSGGGGGGLLSGETEYAGKEAGGISGSGDNSADQSTGNAFGQGESGTNVSGGGSGLYGGYKGTSSKSGGAGSGYIGNSLVSNKKMVGYNVPTSDAERYKTETTNKFSAIAQANKPKMGNGYVIIKFLRDEGDDDMHTYSESEHRVGTWTNGKPVYERIVTVNEFAGTNNQWINTGVNIPNGDEIVFVGFAQVHALSDGFLFNCFAKFNENKDVLAYFATGTYSYYYSRCFIQYTKNTD